MYEFWYDYIKPKYGDKARLCYMDTDSCVMHIKTEDFYKDINVDKWLDTSMMKMIIDLQKLEKTKRLSANLKMNQVEKIMNDFCVLRAKAYAFKLDNDNKVKKAKGAKKCIVKREITFKNYADALFNEVLIKSQKRFRSDHHNVCTEEVNKIALSSNDDKQIHLIKLLHINTMLILPWYVKMK